jgi:hypothetical protein
LEEIGSHPGPDFQLKSQRFPVRAGSCGLLSFFAAISPRSIS